MAAREFGVKGNRFACLELAGAEAVAPSSTALSSLGGINHSLPCKRCHALSPAA